VRRFEPRSDCGACQTVSCTDELYIPPIHHIAAQSTRLAHPTFTSRSRVAAYGNHYRCGRYPEGCIQARRSGSRPHPGRSRTIFIAAALHGHNPRAESVPTPRDADRAAKSIQGALNIEGDDVIQLPLPKTVANRPRAALCTEAPPVGGASASCRHARASHKGRNAHIER
jgi:hypothetical protein